MNSSENSAAKTGFTVMAKPVGSRCNMRCDYCYYLECGGGFSMGDALLEKYIRGYIEACPGRTVQLSWHGGEPLIAGLDFYKKVVAIQEKYLPEGREIWNNLQTNGLLVNDEWAEFFAENRFDVGLSVDGTAELHDKNRHDLGGNGTYSRAAAAVKCLQRHGIQPDLLCTVNADTAKFPTAVYRALRDMGTGWMQFIPVVRWDENGDLTADSVTGEEYGKFLCAVFNEWIHNDLGKTEVQLFAESARVLSGHEASLCWMAKTCGRVIIVEADGGVYSCDHFVEPKFLLGNLESNALSTLAAADFQLNFGAMKSDLPEKCCACKCLALCNGGCPKDRVSVEGEKGINILCAGFERFFAFCEPKIRRVMDMTKRGMLPTDMMKILREENRAIWRGVGRNDHCVCGNGKKAKHCCWELRA